MIIDIHNHADYHQYNPDKTLANMDEYGIDLTCMLSWEAPARECDPAFKWAFSPFSEVPVPFERCVAYKEKAPERFLLGYCPDPRKPDSIQRLIAMTDLYDLSICGELKFRMMYDNPDAIRMYRACAELGLPVLIHLDYEFDDGRSHLWTNYWYGGGIDVLERMLKLCPETNFIGHAPGFWAHISNDDQYNIMPYPKGRVIPGGRIEQLLEKYPNLYCDMSAGSGHNAFSRDVEFAKEFLIRWQDRVLYARDYFGNIHQELLNSLSLPQNVLKKIYEDNARKVLRNGDKIPHR